MDEALTGGLTQADIKKLKKKHGSLTLVTVKDDAGDDLHFWFRKPDMTVMSAVAAVSDKDPIAGTQTLFQSCLVKGDKSIVDDADIFLSVAPHLQQLIKTKTTEVKNF